MNQNLQIAPPLRVKPWRVLGVTENWGLDSCRDGFVALLGPEANDLRPTIRSDSRRSLRRRSLTGGLELGALPIHLGHLGTVRAAAVVTLFERELTDGQLPMDGISVAESARGQRVGTRLVETLISHASQDGYASVRLDVIDTNPTTQHLYERLGLEEVATERFPCLKWLLGFSASTTLEYRTPEPQAAG